MLHFLQVIETLDPFDDLHALVHAKLLKLVDRGGKADMHESVQEIVSHKADGLDVRLAEALLILAAATCMILCDLVEVKRVLFQCFLD